MDYYKKRKIKETLKKYKAVIIGTSAFALTGLIVMLVGFGISGWSFVKWWNKGYGPTCVIMFVLGAFGAGFLWYVFAKLLKE